MRSKTRGEIEADLTGAIVKFEKEFLGCGPEENITAEDWTKRKLRLKQTSCKVSRHYSSEMKGRPASLANY